MCKFENGIFNSNDKIPNLKSKIPNQVGGVLIRKLIESDREKIKEILADTNNFNEEEIKIALELVDIHIKEKDQKDYEIFVDAVVEEANEIRGYVCIGPRPLTEGTYDLYWIAVNPKVQSKGVGSGLVRFIEDYLREKKARLILIETSGKESYEKERKFYEKNSYKELVNIKDFYKVGDSLIIFGKYIEENADNTDVKDNRG